MGTSSIIWSLSLWLLAAGTADPKELYKKAEQQYRNQQFKQAVGTFKKTIQALEVIKKKEKKKSLVWHRLNYGQANALLFISKIAKQRNKIRRSCIVYAQTVKKLAELPKNWRTWNLPEDAKKRLILAQTEFASQCKKVPSIVVLKYTPSNAKVEQLLNGKWSLMKFNPKTLGQVKIEVVESSKLTLRLKAKGYKETKKIIKVAPWSIQSAMIKLTSKPKIIARVRPRVKIPPPIVGTPVTQQWWFWTIIGVAAAGAAVGVVGIVYATTPYTEGIRNCAGQEGFSLWGEAVNCPK